MALDRYNKETSLYGKHVDQETHNDSTGVPQNVGLFSQPGMTKRGHGGGGQTQVQKRQIGPFGRGLCLNLEREEPVHPALQIVSRSLDSDESLRSSSELPRKSVIAKGKRPNRIKALEGFVDDVENLPEMIEHLQMLKAREQTNGDLIREEFRKMGGFSPEEKKNDFLANYFNDYGTEWPKGTDRDNTDEISYENDHPKDGDIPPLSIGTSDSALITSSKPDAKMPSIAGNDEGKPYLSTKVDNEQDDDGVGWMCTFGNEDTFTPIGKPKEDAYDLLLGQEENRMRENNTAMWVNSIEGGAAATDTYKMSPCCCVVIKNIPEYVSEAQISETLGVYGEVLSVMFCDWQEGLKYGIVEMEDTSQADEVVDMFQEVELFGNPPDKPIITVYYNKAF